MISPCRYPNCRDSDGNPVLTNDQFCESCAHRFAMLLQWVAEDYVYLSMYLPRPVSTVTSARGGSVKGYGHPREWASNLAQDIARVSGLYVAAYTGAKNRPAMGQCVATWTRHFDQICEWVQAPDMTQDLASLHREARAGIGETRPVRRLVAPCPRCDVRALTTRDGSDTVQCASCFHRFPTSDIGKNTVTQLARQQRFNFHAIDRLLADYDAMVPDPGQSPELAP